jgi:23S rRNA U2552 (ribose-2'-O)-methylase RlmE/FtsJ
MAHTDVDLSKMMRTYIDGIPLPLASKLLPKKTWVSSLVAHIHYHARSQQKYADKGSKAKKVKISKQTQLSLISSLANAISKLEWKAANTEWGEYYTFTNYSDKSFKQKQKIVKKMILSSKPKTVWDIGANDGSFSRLASDEGIDTVAFDIDPMAVEKNYRIVKKSGEKPILPLVMDLTNPSPFLGWENEERNSMIERGPADLVLALALVHHLAISNNVPLIKLAEFLSKIGNKIIIEFVPKGDSQVNKLLASREDIFDEYKDSSFELALSKFFIINEKKLISGTNRTLYLMTGRRK